MKKIVLVVGCRPDCIKMLPLYMQLKKRKGIETLFVSTGQHKELLHQVCNFFNFLPDYDFDVMEPNQSLADITKIVLEKSISLFSKINPDIVLVHGDTSSAFAVSLACFYLHIPVGHVEAGLRTHDLQSPFPEEFNRQCVGLLANYHFAPTSYAKKNLLQEGKRKENIFVTGNTIIDAMRYTVSESFSHPDLTWAEGHKLIFITVHRRENIGQPMVNIFRAIKRALIERDDCRAIYPLHMNPKVREIARRELAECKNIRLVEPMNVLECHNFESRAYLILTDSGGIQEEAPTYGVPVLVLRNTTERPEGVLSGSLKLVGTDEKRVYTELTKLLDDRAAYEKMSKSVNPFGDGKASERIANILCGEPYKEWIG